MNFIRKVRVYHSEREREREREFVLTTVMGLASAIGWLSCNLETPGEDFKVLVLISCHLLMVRMI